ncbi:MAG: ThiF family adenylyltransferase [Leptolyngbyaceae cyanobacterium MO_188.B28]|nr:ThiF family adenylyltransferase [Leptolyngbyaceae cyanobacterium MO_188.B28]
MVYRIAAAISERCVSIHLYLVDPDTVEPQNTARQCFSDIEADYRLNKAEALALRYALAWRRPNIQLTALAKPFDPAWIHHPYGNRNLTVLLGCVDNFHARCSIQQALPSNSFYSLPACWWIDAGNEATYGQVLIGSSLSTDPAAYTASDLGFARLPAPSLQAPDLLQPPPQAPQPTPSISCAELAVMNTQSITINAWSATAMADLLKDLLLGKLNRLAVFFDQQTGVLRSCYSTPAEIQAALAQSACQ